MAKIIVGMTGYIGDINSSGGGEGAKKKTLTASWLPGPLYRIARKASKTNMTTPMAIKAHMNPRSTATEVPRRDNLPKPAIHHHAPVASFAGDLVKLELPCEPHRTASLRSHTAQYSEKNVAHSTMKIE